MQPIDGKNVVARASSEGYQSMEDVKKAIQAFESQPQADGPLAEGTTAPESNPLPTPTPALETTKDIPAEDGKKDVPQQFRDKEGKLDEAKVQKSSEHLEQLKVKKKDALDAYKKLQREVSQIGQELKDTKETVRPALDNLIESQDYPPEVRKRIQEDIEKDAVGTILNLMTAAQKKAEAAARRLWEQEQAEKMQERMIQRLDDLASNGNEWLLTPEGQTLMGEKLKEDPNLWKTRDPYGYALASLRHEGRVPQVRQAAPAQSAPGTPILGASHAVPPPSTAPAASKIQTMERLKDEYLVWAQRGNKQKMAEIMGKMDVLERGY